MALSFRRPAPGGGGPAVGIAVICGILALIPESAGAQWLPLCPTPEDQLVLSLPVRSCVSHDAGGILTDPAALGGGRADIQSDEVRLGAGRAFLYSALLPGASQWKLGQRRWIAYLILEGATWVAFGRARTSALDLRDRYQTLAWNAARIFAGPRIDGDFAYYEALEKFERSGALDVDPSAPGVQPQTDPSTFNGRTWALAMQIFFASGTDPMPGDQAYDDALAFYQAEGYEERFEWSWVGRPGEWEGYRDLIESSDEDFRRASQFVGVVIANHLLSGVDGFVTARVRAAAGDRSMARLRISSDESAGRIEIVLQVRR